LLFPWWEASTANIPSAANQVAVSAFVIQINPEKRDVNTIEVCRYTRDSSVETFQHFPRRRFIVDHKLSLLSHENLGPMQSQVIKIYKNHENDDLPVAFDGFCFGDPMGPYFQNLSDRATSLLDGCPTTWIHWIQATQSVAGSP